MRIEITRSGGFAGLTRTWTLEVSRTEAEQRWLPLAAEADAAVEGSGAGAAPVQQRDRFTYRIAIGYTEVYLAESALADPWRELIERARAATPARSPVDGDHAGTTPGAGVPQPEATDTGTTGTGAASTGATDTGAGKPGALEPGSKDGGAEDRSATPGTPPPSKP